MLYWISVKKVFSTILLVIYLTFSAGATMHLHYCMGEFAGISLTDTNESTCGKCGMESHDEKNECCKDVPVSLKITDDQASSSCEQTVDRPWVQLEAISPLIYLVQPLRYKLECSISFCFSPPGYTTRIYIQNRNLRI
ncbi:HYC_CC_PP family protein [Cnuella takakiae]